MAVALLKGTLDVLVLKALSWTPMHAVEIANWLEERSGSRVVVEDAAMLQALHRMEARKLITADWGVTQNGRRARYYRLAPAGRKHLQTETAHFVEHFDALLSILGARKA
jgi:DNA-binding PadR family transcriptional regulator